MTLYFQQTALGKLGIAEQDGNITEVYFANEVIPQDVELAETALISEAFLQLNAYLAGELTGFSLPLAPRGTVFQQTVWQALCSVPYASTASYKDIAVAIGNPKAVRAVGQANNKNPLPIFIPCHRIIGSNGKLVGYSAGLEIKEFLLALEKRNVPI
ncbi:MAG: methylated-DNA-[protein]-cysteine S-methyltransferase [Methylococcaceae bacterium NSP1-2]|nr:methylated-DNA--[protein]-cysteine S-methyltransferase [Methylococcaceae bacterium]OYV21268.1 MAG: methylated-DNA-[protein]-cysteine S-methyltransferase [Methylococcaceae bacterium NSP1-2]